MIDITLPDGSVRQFGQSVTVHDVAKDIGEGLGRATLAGEVDGELVDVSYSIQSNCTLRIITDRDPEGLDIIRHSTAHLLAQAVKGLYPEAQVTIGPVIENGFYYDFSYPLGFGEEDLRKIEARMVELAKADLEVCRMVENRDSAVQRFKEIGEEYKAEIIREIPEGEPITLYSQGDFVDLCRGPHVPRTGHLKAFKLTQLAGAYWRGDSEREMLQRVYGTAWPNRKELDAYLHRIEDAEKRDHRKLGRQLDLFHFQEDAPGMVFWHRNGWMVYRVVERYVRSLLQEYDYEEVQTPQLMDHSMWKRSGHWDKFRQHMFTTHIDERDYVIKPMNCPGHVQIFNHPSYRGIRPGASERTFRHSTRVAPGPTLHARRCPRFLHPGPTSGRGRHLD